VEAGDGIDCYLRLHKGHRSRGWLHSTPSLLARTQAGVFGNFRKNPNPFPLSDMTSTVVGKKEQMIERHDVVSGDPREETRVSLVMSVGGECRVSSQGTLYRALESEAKATLKR